MQQDNKQNKNTFASGFTAICKVFDLPRSHSVLFSGTDASELASPPPDLVERLSRRIGLSVEEKKISDLLDGNIDYPVLVEIKPAVFVPITGETDRGALVVAGHDQSNIKLLDRAKVAKLTSARVYNFTRVYRNNAEGDVLVHGRQLEKHNWLWSSIKPFWKSFAMVAVAALFINLIALASPLFVMNVYDRVLPNAALSTLWVLAIGVALAIFFDLILKTTRAALIDYSARKIDIRLSQLIFEKILNIQMEKRLKSTGEFASRVTQYEFVREFFSSNTLATAIDIVFVFIFLFVIWAIGGMMALVPFVALLLTLAIGFAAQYRISTRIAAAANEAAQRQALLVETISVAETVKYLRAEGVLLKRWRELTVNSTRTQEEIKAISSGATNATQFVQQFVTVGIILVGAYLFQQGTVSTGAIIASVILSGRAIAPLAQVASTLARFRQAYLSLTILNQIMDLPEDNPTTAGFVNRVVQRGDVAFEKVSFAYEDSDHHALDNVSFSIKAGERVGVIGRIGSGKTTISRLIGALYTPQEGRVSIDGVDIRQYHPAEVRKSVAIAGQTGDLFTGTVKENLLIANPTATDEEILEAARKSGIDEFVTRHPRGFDMMVGENGNALSSGQRQSLTVARLLLLKPKIVFLDEPSGALDLASERKLLNNLKTAFDENTTLIVATHRHSMLDLVDRLLIVEDGKLIADGPKAAVFNALQDRANRATP